MCGLLGSAQRSLVAGKVGPLEPYRTRFGWRLEPTQHGERALEDCHHTGTLGTGHSEHLEKTLTLSRGSRGSRKDVCRLKMGVETSWPSVTHTEKTSTP